MREVFAQVARVASSSCTVLITGETGTGKELVAQAIHYTDATRSGPLVAVNCAALPEPLLESEFFGHERGAFTGADRQKKGRFEQAKGGTLLLDEIGELPWGCRPSCSASSRTGRFERVGGSEVIQADCRILAATNLNLAEAVAAGRFREDLYLPPQRRRDRAAPAPRAHRRHPAAGRATSSGRLQERRLPAKTVSRETLSRLARYDWPGNVRELEHVLEQVVVTTPGPVIEPENLPPQIVSTREEPFTPRFRPEPPAPGDHRRADRADRARLPPARPRALSRPDRPLRGALRPLAAEHQREAPPLRDRQGQLQVQAAAPPGSRPGRVGLERRRGPLRISTDRRS